MRNYTKNLKKRKLTRKKNKKNISKKRGGAYFNNSHERSRERSRERVYQNFRGLYFNTSFYSNKHNNKYAKVYTLNVHGERISTNPKYQDSPDMTDRRFNWPVIYLEGTSCLTATNVGGWGCLQMNGSIQHNMKILLGTIQKPIEVDNMYLPNTELDNYMLTSARNHMDTTYNESNNCTGILECDPVILLGTGDDIERGQIRTNQISEIHIKGRIEGHADGRALTLNDALHLIEIDFDKYYKNTSTYNMRNIGCIVFVVHCREQQGFERSYKSEAEAEAAGGTNTQTTFLDFMAGASQPNLTFKFSDSLPE